MHYHKISINGFGPYEEEISFDFDKGLTLVIGKNGSGKSSIFDAIQWAMFGPAKSVRAGGDKMSIINTHSHKAVVNLDLEFEDSTYVTISRTLTRGSKHMLKVSIDGEEIEGGITIQQEKINSLLTGLEHDSFAAVSMLMSSPSSVVNEFITGDPKRRRVILSDIVDPNHTYEKRHKEVKEQITKANKNHQTLIGDKRTLDEIIESKVAPEYPEGDIKKLKRKLDNIISKINEINRSSEGTSLVIARREYENKIDRLDKRKEKAKKSINKDEKFIEKFNNKKTSLENRLETLYEKKDTVDEDLEYRKAELDAASYIYGRYEKIVSLYEENIKGINKEITQQNTLSSLWDDDRETCAVCGSEIDENSHKYHNDALEHIGELEKIKDNIKDIIKKYKNKVHLAQENIDVDKAEIAALQSSESLESIIEDIENSLDDINEDLEDAKSSIKKNQQYINVYYEEEKGALLENIENIPSTKDSEELESLEKKRDYLSDEINDIKIKRSRYKDYEEDIKDLQERIKEAEKSIEKSEDNLQKLQKEKQDTSPTGLISKDIDKISELITDYANDMYEELFNTTSSGILIKSYKENSSGEEEPTCVITMGGRSLSSYSHGEQSRAISAILLGLVQSVYEYSGQWYVPLWDEPTVTIDNSATEIFFSKIGEIIEKTDNQAIIITRDNVHPKNSKVIDLAK